MSNYWLVKNDWNNHGTYEDAAEGCDVVGIFDSFDLAVEAIRKIYKNEFDVSVINEALRFSHLDENKTFDRWEDDVDWVYDYNESVNEGWEFSVIDWTREGEWDTTSFDYVYYIIPINMNEARCSW